MARVTCFLTIKINELVRNFGGGASFRFWKERLPPRIVLLFLEKRRPKKKKKQKEKLYKLSCPIVLFCIGRDWDGTIIKLKV